MPYQVKKSTCGLARSETKPAAPASLPRSSRSTSDDRNPCTDANAERSYTNWGISWGFKSRHPGGAVFLFGDGSVHFLSEDIHHDTYQLLGCRNDGRHIEEIP